MRDDRITNLGIRIDPVQGDAKDILPVYDEAIVGKFITDIKQYDENTGEPGRQSRNIDYGEKLVPPDIPEGNDEGFTEHAGNL